MIWRIGGPAALSPSRRLRGWLSRKETEASVRKAAIRAIGCISQGTYHAGNAKKWLKQTIDDDDPEIVKQAVWATGVIGDNQLLPRLRALCEKPNFYAQDYAPTALEALGRFGRLSKDSVKLFIDVLGDDSKDVSVPEAAASILGNIGEVSEVWAPLAKVANDPLTDPDLQVGAGLALASISPQYQEALGRAQK